MLDAGGRHDCCDVSAGEDADRVCCSWESIDWQFGVLMHVVHVRVSVGVRCTAAI